MVISVTLSLRTRLKLSPYDRIPKLEKAFAAFDDLDCAELLGPA